MSLGGPNDAAMANYRRDSETAAGAGARRFRYRSNRERVEELQLNEKNKRPPRGSDRRCDFKAKFGENCRNIFLRFEILKYVKLLFLYKKKVFKDFGIAIFEIRAFEKSI